MKTHWIAECITGDMKFVVKPPSERAVIPFGNELTRAVKNAKNKNSTGSEVISSIAQYNQVSL